MPCLEPFGCYGLLFARVATPQRLNAAVVHTEAAQADTASLCLTTAAWGDHRLGWVGDAKAPLQAEAFYSLRILAAPCGAEPLESKTHSIAAPLQNSCALNTRPALDTSENALMRADELSCAYNALKTQIFGTFAL